MSQAWRVAQYGLLYTRCHRRGQHETLPLVVIRKCKLAFLLCSLARFELCCCFSQHGCFAQKVWYCFTLTLHCRFSPFDAVWTLCQWAISIIFHSLEMVSDRFQGLLGFRALRTCRVWVVYWSFIFRRVWHWRLGSLHNLIGWFFRIRSSRRMWPFPFPNEKKDWWTVGLGAKFVSQLLYSFWGVSFLIFVTVDGPGAGIDVDNSISTHFVIVIISSSIALSSDENWRSKTSCSVCPFLLLHH